MGGIAPNQALHPRAGTEYPSRRGRDDLAAGIRHGRSAHNNLGLVLQGLGKSEAAVASFRRVIEIAPGLVSAYFNLARALLRMKDPDGARRVIEKLLELHPGQPQAKEWLRQMGESERR